MIFIKIALDFQEVVGNHAVMISDLLRSLFPILKYNIIKNKKLMIIINLLLILSLFANNSFTVYGRVVTENILLL